MSHAMTKRRIRVPEVGGSTLMMGSSTDCLFHRVRRIHAERVPTPDVRH